MKRRIYLAGPYSSNPEKNTRAALEIAHRLLDMDLAPFVPHLTHYLELVESRPYEEWLKFDLAFLAVCEAVYRLPGESPGADREVAEAHRLGLPVFTRLLEVCEWAGGRGAGTHGREVASEEIR